MSQAVQATLYILHQSYGIFIEGRGITQEAQGDAQDGPQAIQISLPAVVVAFQLGLVERDIDHVIYGHLINQTGGQSEGSEELESGAQTQRVVLEGDVCPICQEALLGPSPLTYCKFGCGNSVHLKCIRVYAGHLKITGDVPCPLCRNNLKRCSAKKVGVDIKGARSVHLGVTCTSCGVCPVVGRCYRCFTCEGCSLCKACCEEVTGHRGHSMEFRQHPDQPWRQARLAQLQVPASIPPDLISSLHSRSITEEDSSSWTHTPGGTHIWSPKKHCAPSP
eukprot:Em0004g32a